MKKININIIITLLATLSLLVSCDIIDKPLEHGSSKIDTTYAKKVLVEDYTAFYCGNCPKAHLISHQLIEDYGDNVVVMAVHAGFYAKPTAQHTYDFRTATGTEWDELFGCSAIGLPEGLINRKDFGTSSKVMYHTSWAQYAEQALAEKPIVTLSLSASYIPNTKAISVTVNYNYLEDSKVYHNLNVCITEDSIVNYQLWYGHTPLDIEDYVHDHVFRYSFNGSWGDKLTQAKGTKQYSYTIPSGSDWRPEKLNIVAFISDVGNTYEVLQAEQVKLIK